MLGFFIGFLTVVLALVSLLMVFIVLMQRPKQEGLGAAFGGGVTDQMWGAQTTNVLQRGTVYLAVMFFAITLILAVLVNAKQKGLRDQLDELAKTTPPAMPEAPVAPALTSGDPSFDNISLTGDGTTTTPTPGAPNTPIAPITEAPKPIDTTTPPADTTAPPTDATTPPTDATTPPADATTTPDTTAPDVPAPAVDDAETDAAAEIEKLLEGVDADPAGAAVDAVEEAGGAE